MRYVSLFSGIDAVSVATQSLGWEAAAFCEIEPFPSAVLAHHYPNVPNLGDVTKVDWKEFGNANGPIDLVVFGSPCQSFSVAGKRLGLDDPRGNLALYALGVVDVLRPKWFVFENVPGLLSSAEGRDFGAFLGTVEELGYGWAYRIIDAQFCRTRGHPRAVPQRRRRVFVVGHLGDWRRAAAVLFERESLCGHPPPRRETREGTARGFETGPHGGGFTDLAPTMDARAKDGPIRNQLGVGVITTDVSQTLLGKSNSSHDHTQESYVGVITQSVANPLTARMHKGVNTTMDEGQTMVDHALRGEGHDASEDGTGRGTPIVAVSPTLRAGGNRTGGDRPPGTDVDTCDSLVPIAFPERMSGTQVAAAVNVSPSLGATNPTAIAFDCKGTQVQTDETGAAPTLRSMSHDASHQNGGGQLAIAIQGAATRENPSSGPDGVGVRTDGAAYTLEARQEVQAVAFDTTQITSPGNYSKPQLGDPCHPLAAEAHPPAVAFQERGRDGGRSLEIGGDVAFALTAPNGGGRAQERNIAHGWAVRRLTPLECERLQGFPDGYTNVPYRGKPAADGPRYKALGNSMAINVVRWIFERIQAVEELSNGDR